jgi:hypothetical protein
MDPFLTTTYYLLFIEYPIIDNNEIFDCWITIQYPQKTPLKQYYHNIYKGEHILGWYHQDLPQGKVKELRTTKLFF